MSAKEKELKMVLTTWTLIILWTNRDYRTSPTLEQVPGFRTQTACIVAGNTVLKNMAKNYNTQLAKAICVAMDDR
jgi:hypothetical protein